MVGINILARLAHAEACRRESTHACARVYGAVWAFDPVNIWVVDLLNRMLTPVPR